ncbi:hypothetical protein PV327_006185 [Microctonus hyperodae]|uniref:Disintegrin and metalloproteinase domain-containing protein 12 n=1 Tax=Microctonus hyperodae TaxID=165561 RepID=A0AA39F3R8_MICHY|nr:hypothetical protein PV327_006185 [Microctonus hyperodae]
MAGDIWRGYDASSFSILFISRRLWCSELVLWKFLLFISLLSSILLCTNAASDHIKIPLGPSAEFSSHVLVQPRVFHGRSKREIFDTKENDYLHSEILTVGFQVDGVDRILDLRLNTDLIPVGYKQRTQKNGKFQMELPDKVELCHYQGSVRGIPDSWVAVSTCKGLRGVIFDGENMHHIHSENESLDSNHYLYKHSDLLTNHTCGYEGTVHEVETPTLHGHRLTRRKRTAEVVRGPYNANRQSRYVELVLVVDKKEYVALDENLDKVYHHCKDIANIINALYTPLNIFIALVGVEVWTDSDEIQLSTKGDTTLANFLRYRREMLVKEMPNDNAQLLTRITFEDAVVGKALKGPICTYEFSGGVSMDHSNVIGLVAATVAHEMGHNFGMEHDSAECLCPEDRCIMARSSGTTSPTHWSSCSLDYLSQAFQHGMDYCLRNKPTKLFDSPICGNGFVESGEQCDCGLEENCDNPCCNATTCMLHSNASCATGECCDLNTCRPKNAGTECRSAEHECDLPEYCTGQSEYCPSDVYKVDGESCSKGKAYCYQGSCRTHNDQCKLLWGPSGTSSDAQCYDMNNKGTIHGNCGYNRIDASYIKCNDHNILCGMLHCKHLNERLEFGMESVAILSHSFINNGGTIIACRTAIVDLGLNQVDPGLAPDGAKCAPGKMCVNQKCLPVEDLRITTIGKEACPNNCGGNGVCNSLGHCHCNRGFRPPDCLHPGFGGSDDSGPAQDPNARNDVITALYVIFLGILPVIALVLLAMWYRKNNPTRPGWKKDVIPPHDRGFIIKTIDRPSSHHHHPHHHHPMSRGIETIDSSLSQDPACATLLPKTDADERFNNNLFGQFKGFTLTPISTVKSATNKSSLDHTKPAPPPPTVPTVMIKTNIKPPQRNNILKSAFMSQSIKDNATIQNTESLSLTSSLAPALPPLNSGSTARPLISSPVLAATTCTSMELINTAALPTRPAPEVPARPPETLSASSTSLSTQKPSRPNSTPLVNIIIESEKDKRHEKEKNTTLSRIASILKPGNGIIRMNSQQKDEKTNSLPRNQQNHRQKAIKVIDKEILRNLEISNPIPQTEIDIPASMIPVVPLGTDNVAVDGEKKSVIMRAQSMRDGKLTNRPTIHTFGSMRQSNSYKRPISIPASARPTSPPPPVPPSSSTLISDKSVEDLKIPGLPGYQNPPMKVTHVNSTEAHEEDTYDDCMNLVGDNPLTNIMEESLSPSNDNIYAVIEDPIPLKKGRKLFNFNDTNEYKIPKPIDSTATASETMGLLSEIVSEISNRNFDSIYSTSTLTRQKKEKEEAKIMGKNFDNLGSNSSLGTYVNSNSNHYKSPSSVYSNSVSKFNSAVSETSSGYLLPSAVNAPRNIDDNKQIVQKSNEKSTEQQQIDDCKLDSLKSTNPNVNDDMSKALGLKPIEIVTKSTLPSSSLSTRQNSSVKKNEMKKDDIVKPIKPPLNRTITPPGISRNTSKVEAAKNIRQNSDTSLKSTKSYESKTHRQNSDTSLKSNKSAKEKKDNIISTPPKSPSTNSIKCKNNSPDLVSSCSTSSSNTSESPDVVGDSAKVKTNQKTKTMQPPRPNSIVTKAATFSERKKSPMGGNISLVKSPLSSNIIKETNKPLITPKSVGLTNKIEAKNEIKCGPVQKAAGSKTNVASLQQKFEQNKATINPVRSISSVKKSITSNINNNSNNNNNININKSDGIMTRKN